MRHQREFIKAIIRQVLDDPDPMKLFNVVDACANMVTTDLSATDIIALASELRGIDVESDIYTAHAPSYAAMLGDISYVFVSQWQLDEVMGIIDRGDDPGPYVEDLVVDTSGMPSQPVSYEEPTYYYEDDYEEEAVPAEESAETADGGSPDEGGGETAADGGGEGDIPG